MQDCCREVYIAAIEERLASGPPGYFNPGICLLCQHQSQHSNSCVGCPAHRGFCNRVSMAWDEERGRLLRKRLSQLKRGRS
jgi:hypothetical protein